MRKGRNSRSVKISVSYFSKLFSDPLSQWITEFSAPRWITFAVGAINHAISRTRKVLLFYLPAGVCSHTGKVSSVATVVAGQKYGWHDIGLGWNLFAKNLHRLAKKKIDVRFANCECLFYVRDMCMGVSFAQFFQFISIENYIIRLGYLVRFAVIHGIISKLNTEKMRLDFSYKSFYCCNSVYETTIAHKLSCIPAIINHIHCLLNCQ